MKILKPAAIATAISGTLDILFAMALTLLYSREPAAMLRYVASGPFPGAAEWGPGGALLGLLVHFALMAVIASVLMLLFRAKPKLLARPLHIGIAYGLLTYFVMNWIVVPLRFGTSLPPGTMAILTQLFAHIVLVGIPMAIVARRVLANSRRDRVSSQR